MALTMRNRSIAARTHADCPRQVRTILQFPGSSATNASTSTVQATTALAQTVNTTHVCLQIPKVYQTQHY
jgi:hypothetical protein